MSHEAEAEVSIEIVTGGGGYDGDLVAKIAFDYSKATSDYFNKSLGAWLPGDPGEIHRIEATLYDVKRGPDGSWNNATYTELECPAWLETAIRELADDDAFNEAVADDGPDPDEAYDRMRDEGY